MSATMTYADALAIVRREAEDRANWQSAMTKIGELLVAADDAEKVVAGQAKRKAQLEGEIVKLEREVKQREEHAAELQAKIARFASEIEQGEALAHRRLEGVTKQTARVEAQLKEAEEALARITEIGRSVAAR